jgi:hypothetical protein
LRVWRKTRIGPASADGVCVSLFRGKYIDHGKPVESGKPGFEHKKLDADAGIQRGLNVT